MSLSSSSSCHSELQVIRLAPLRLVSHKKEVSTSTCETPRDAAWEKRRHQMKKQERNKKNCVNDNLDDNNNNITDEDLHELKGCIELGFGFNEEEGQKLCNTLPALDLYFAVSRQLSPSPGTTPRGPRSTSTCSSSMGSRSSSFESPRSSDSEPTWKICSPGDDPQQVKTKLRHWAQAVACSVMQSH